MLGLSESGAVAVRAVQRAPGAVELRRAEAKGIMTSREKKLFDAVPAAGEIRGGDLAKATGLDYASVYIIARRLVEQGYLLSRTEEDADGTVKWFRRTTFGQ